MATVELDEDLEQACKHRDIDITDVLRVVLKLTGENDGADWHWIVRTQEGYAYIAGGCSYTGWDYGNTVERFDSATLKDVLKLCPMDVRRVFEDMRSKKETVRSNTGGL